MSTFAERKAERVRYFEKYVRGWKLVTCTACSGSGYYDSHGSPACSCCGGTGKMRTAPSTLAQQVASAQAEVATWSEERRKSVRLAGGDQP